MSGLCVRSVACSPNGKNSKSNSWDDAIRLSDFESDYASVSHCIIQRRWNSKLVFGVAASRGGRRMCSVSDYETAQVWDARTAEQSGHQ